MTRPPAPTARRRGTRLLRALALSTCLATGAAGSRAAAAPDAQARLLARSVLAPAAYRAGSPPCGAFLSAADRDAAAANGVVAAPGPAYFREQPIQGFSSMVPADGTTWWALADNGFARRENSADVELAIHRVDPRWGEAGGPRVLETVVLRDPDRRVPWALACDPSHGTPLPDFSFNLAPAWRGPHVPDPRARRLSGFDFDPESFVRAPDGTFWIGEEFGPFLLHVAADGRLLEPPIDVPGIRSPQHPFLDLTDRARPQAPNLATSRGFEGLAIDPGGTRLYALLEGAVSGDDPQDLRLLVYDLVARSFLPSFLRVRLEMPSQTVDLSRLVDASGARVYPQALAPPAGPAAIGELKAVDDHRFLLIERDNLGDGVAAPRFKKVFLLDLAGAAGRGGYVEKAPLLDLLAVPDPAGVGGDGDYFRLPFYTIESVHVVDDRTLLVASDDNFPFSNGRARGASPHRSGPLAPDATEMILVRLGSALGADPRLLPAAAR